MTYFPPQVFPPHAGFSPANSGSESQSTIPAGRACDIAVKIITQFCRYIKCSAEKFEKPAFAESLSRRQFAVDQNYIFADLFDVAPGYNNIVFPAEKTEKLAAAVNYKRLYGPVANIYFNVADVPKFAPVADIDYVLEAQILYAAHNKTPPA
jgi:hypothetical protein